MDFDGLSMKQVKGLPPSFAIKLLNFIQDAMPLRLKEVRINNILPKILLLFKKFYFYILHGLKQMWSINLIITCALYLEK